MQGDTACMLPPAGQGIKYGRYQPARNMPMYRTKSDATTKKTLDLPCLSRMLDDRAPVSEDGIDAVIFYVGLFRQLRQHF